MPETVGKRDGIGGGVCFRWQNLEAESSFVDRGEADKPGTELGEEAVASRDEDGGVSRPERREVS